MTDFLKRFMPGRGGDPAVSGVSVPAAVTAAGAGAPAQAAAAAAVVLRENSRWLMGIIRWAIFITVFAVPLFYLPVTQDALFAKVVLVETAAIVAGAAWLINILFVKRIEYKRNPLNLVLAALVLIMLAAAVFSRAPWQSFWGPDVTGEKAATILAFVILSFVTAAAFSRRAIERAVKALLVSFAVLAFFALFSILAGWAGWQLPAWLNVNPAGTTNAFAYVLGAGFILSFGLWLTAKTSRGKESAGKWVKILALAVSIVLFAALVFLGFRMLWIGLGVALVFLLAGNFARTWRRENGESEYAMASVPLGIGFLILALSAFLAYKPLPFAASVFQPPAEVAPALGTTLDIARRVLKESPIVGFGPANFQTAYNLFRDVSLNNTIFWTVRFNHGYSFLATILATGGVLGFLAFLALAAGAVLVVGREMWKVREPSAHLWAFWGVLVFVAIMWFLYASNFAATFLFFMALGLAAALLPELKPAPEGENARFLRLDIGRRSFSMGAPAVNFVTSLTAVFMAAFSLVALYSLIAQFSAEVYLNRAVRALTRFGNTDTAKVFLDKAAGLNPTNDDYYQWRAQAALVALNQIVARAASGQVLPGEDLAARFRNELSEGVAAAQRGRDLAPWNPQNWFLLGQLYEAVIPYFPDSGADKLAIDAYKRASEVDPVNPVLPLARGRVRITVSDLMTLRINQTSSGEDRSRLEAARKEIYADGREALEKAVALKVGFAEAHFLLAQFAIRENNLEEAIRRTADTARLAPGDTGVAFQLGVLYYRAQDLDRAKAEFERAILLNDDYSNARYFLGLIWDRKGDKDAALSQFQKIAALNPDNEEVKRIMVNLEAGKSALDGIVPPAPAPETRKEAPVKEGEEKPQKTAPRSPSQAR